VTEQFAEQTDALGERPEPTGIERVDAVLDAVAGLGDQPVADHVAVFEQAHTELRAALDPS
jgi:hypothetical protein